MAQSNCRPRHTHLMCCLRCVNYCKQTQAHMPIGHCHWLTGNCRSTGQKSMAKRVPSERDLYANCGHLVSWPLERRLPQLLRFNIIQNVTEWPQFALLTSPPSCCRWAMTSVSLLCILWFTLSHNFTLYISNICMGCIYRLFASILFQCCKVMLYNIYLF